mgnify:CR=1 FL=1
MADTADLPEIYVMVGDAGVELLVDAPYDLNGNYLVIDKDNVSSLDGKTITGTYHRRRDYRKVEKSKVVL